jgi:hypothetical protein
MLLAIVGMLSPEEEPPADEQLPGNAPPGS